MLKVEGIAFRFLPDPAQIRNALEVSYVLMMEQLVLSGPVFFVLFYFRFFFLDVGL